MSDPLLWARTDEQVARVQAARTKGGRCGACGRELAADETVYWERFGLGAVRNRPLAPIRPRSRAYAPVGAECATPAVLAHAAARGFETCAGCGRGVVHPGAKRTRQRPSCSHWCDNRAWREARPEPPTQPKDFGSVTERWGARLRRLRVARGMSREELADACALAVRLGPRIDIRRYEDGGRLPPVRTFAALAGALGVSMETLLYGEAEAVRIARERAYAESATHGEPADAAD